MDDFFGGFDDAEDDELDAEEDVPFATTLASVVKPGVNFSHEYDFGSTTELRLRQVSERTGPIVSRAVAVLARNNPPAIVCGACGQSATNVCMMCSRTDTGWLCDACAKRHPCNGGEEGMMLPVVNSPRVGVCGYDGPYERA